MQSHHDIAIIGAGPVGGALACALAARGRRVALIDKAALPPMEHPDFDGRAYAIAAGSKRLLDAGGLWDALPFPPCPILDIARHRWPARTHRPRPCACILIIARSETTRSAGSSRRGHCASRINRRLHEHENILLRAPSQASVARNSDGVRVSLDSGEVHRGPPRGGGRRAQQPACGPRRESPSRGWSTGNRPWCARWPMKSRIKAWRWSIFCPAARSRSCR